MHHIDCPDDTWNDVPAIGKLIPGGRNDRHSEKTFEDYIDKRERQPHFANARSIRNPFDPAREATRLFARRSDALTADDLMTIEVDAILVSRVFQGGTGGDSMKDQK